MRKVGKDKRVLSNCHIYTMLEEAASERHISLHTPGHKVGKWDITELPFSDNLSAPRGCIARAQADIARILGAYAAYILTDGSTAGVLSMLFTAQKRGVKRLGILEKSHKSVYNGCALFGITPVLLSTPEERGIPLPFDEGNLGDLDVDALFLTSPDYYGNIPRLQAIRAWCDERKKLLLIDGAHGGHLHFVRELYAGTYADLWVDGVHKSLPSLTQGAVVCARTQSLAETLWEGVNIFRTTSPSYPIMASVEYAVKYGRNEWLETQVAAWKTREKRLYNNADWTKLCLFFGKSAQAAWQTLLSEGIYAEFCDGNVVTCYLSPVMGKTAFLRLKKRLKALFEQYPYEEIQRTPTPLVLQTTGEKEWVDLARAEGRICAENCGLFPPCTPLILRGERVEREKIERLVRADDVFGVKEGKIAVFKAQKEE